MERCTGRRGFGGKCSGLVHGAGLLVIDVAAHAASVHACNDHKHRGTKNRVRKKAKESEEQEARSFEESVDVGTMSMQNPSH